MRRDLRTLPPPSLHIIAGRRLSAAKVTMREYWLNNIGLGNTMRPSVRSVVIAANTLLRSAGLGDFGRATEVIRIVDWIPF